MPKFTVKQTQLAYVSWFYEIEADDEEAALDAFYQGDHDGAFRHEIGDNSSLADSTEEVLEAEPEAPAKPLKMGRVFYSGSERFEGFGGLGWYYQIDTVEPVGPFETQLDAGKAARTTIVAE